MCISVFSLNTSQSVGHLLGARKRRLYWIQEIMQKNAVTNSGVEVEILLPFTFRKCMPDDRLYLGCLEETGWWWVTGFKALGRALGGRRL